MLRLHLQKPELNYVPAAQGDTDQAVESYLKGELISTGANCDHHHEEGHSCGGHEEGHSCGDSCGAHQPAFTGRNVNKTCVFTTKVHLTTVRSLILLMTVENLWNSPAEPVR